MEKSTRVDGNTLFAQPLEPSRPRRRPSQRRLLTPGVTLAVLLTGASAVLLGLARPNSAQNMPASKGKSETTSRSPIVLAQNTGATRSAADTATADTSGRRPISFYTQEVRGSMFSAPQPPAVKVEAPIKEKPIPPVKVEPLVINPLAGWAYNASATVGDKKLALLENVQTKEGQWVHVGDNFMGTKVDSISDQMVTVTSMGKPTMLAKSDTINVTQLDRSAAYLTAQPTQQGPQGQPGQMQMNMMTGAMGIDMSGVQAVGNGATVTLPNGTVLSGPQAQRYNQRMNGRFNGGGRGGGGFGGRGGRGGGGGYGGGG
jgi:uncharacterized membrane protein YgcG